MRMWSFITILVITAFICNSPAYAYDNNPLQDICVAVNDSQASVFMNGKMCKDPKLATANDFYFSGLNVSGNEVPGFGISAKIVGVNNMPGLNTLGISLARADLEPQRIIPLHTHPRATEMITILEAFVNGKICKDPKLATPNDFYFAGLNVSGNEVSGLGFALKTVYVNDMPGLNTLGISIGRLDMEPQRLAPLHTHPRATELLTVLEGTLYVGFLVPDPANFFKSRLFSKILNPGDVFVFPIGLIHFLYNVGHKKAVAFGTFNSQNPGFVIIPNSIFASNPPISDDILAQGFQLNKTQIAELRKKFS